MSACRVCGGALAQAVAGWGVHLLCGVPVEPVELRVGMVRDGGPVTVRMAAARAALVASGFRLAEWAL